MDCGTRRELTFQAGKAVHEAFVKYDENFKRITLRARQRFETRDWHGAQRDLGERIELYTKSIDRTVGALIRLLGEVATDRQLWREIKQLFGERVGGIPDGAFCKTFFNSVCRRIFHTVGTDPDIEFVDIHYNNQDAQRRGVNSLNYLNWSGLTEIIEQLLLNFPFEIAYTALARDVERIAAKLNGLSQAGPGGNPEVLRLEFLPSVFYQSTRAYLVGQAFWATRSAPLVIALKNTDTGIEVDAVLSSTDDISILFGFTRSYFFVDIEPVEAAVFFISSLLPHKPIDELYTVFGRVRQGKTERYRAFSRHLELADDHFVDAPGDRGLVMIVFTLPSYDLVFKVIRDRFGFPKNTSRAEVIEKYQFVFKHDRAGRLIDSQEFTQIEFPISKFAPGLRDELLHEAAETTRIEGDQLVLDHLYIERRLRPLNLYIKEAERSAAELAIIDYGQAIKDLAQTNVFPGDLLLKNFGVTRHGRVIFYDYDELCLVTDCNFRELPVSAFEEDEMRPRPWFHVNKNDVFPAEFIRFLAMDSGLKNLFLEVHEDLLTVDYWRNVQQQHHNAKVPEVVPYFRPVVRNRTRSPRATQ